MPAKDIYHETVKQALIKDGWLITHDPLSLKWGTKDMYVDLGAEKLVLAEKIGRKIAVEIKSFVGPSEIENLKNALGSYLLYADVLKYTDPERELYLAIRSKSQSVNCCSATIAFKSWSLISITRRLCNGYHRHLSSHYSRGVRAIRADCVCPGRDSE